eukprot:jgi/Mesen1/10114/ME000075S09619
MCSADRNRHSLQEYHRHRLNAAAQQQTASASNSPRGAREAASIPSYSSLYNSWHNSPYDSSHNLLYESSHNKSLYSDSPDAKPTTRSPSPRSILRAGKTFQRAVSFESAVVRMLARIRQLECELERAHYEVAGLQTHRSELLARLDVSDEGWRSAERARGAAVAQLDAVRREAEGKIQDLQAAANAAAREAAGRRAELQAEVDSLGSRHLAALEELADVKAGAERMVPREEAERQVAEARAAAKRATQEAQALGAKLEAVGKARDEAESCKAAALKEKEALLREKAAAEREREGLLRERASLRELRAELDRTKGELACAKVAAELAPGKAPVVAKVPAEAISQHPRAGDLQKSGEDLQASEEEVAWESEGSAAQCAKLGSQLAGTAGTAAAAAQVEAQTLKGDLEIADQRKAATSAEAAGVDAALQAATAEIASLEKRVEGAGKEIKTAHLKAKRSKREAEVGAVAGAHTGGKASALPCVRFWEGAAGAAPPSAVAGADRAAAAPTGAAAETTCAPALADGIAPAGAAAAAPASAVSATAGTRELPEQQVKCQRRQVGWADEAAEARAVEQEGVERAQAPRERVAACGGHGIEKGAEKASARAAALWVPKLTVKVPGRVHTPSGSCSRGKEKEEKGECATRQQQQQQQQLRPGGDDLEVKKAPPGPAAAAAAAAARPCCQLAGGTGLAVDPGNIRDRFKLGKELGRGHFGVVKACEEVGTGKAFACKSVLKANLKKEEEVEELRAEIKLMRYLRGHAHVVEMHALFEDQEAVHLVMELQIVLAVQHCHARGVIHRDLKPENIIFARIGDEFQEPSVKIADFGLAVMLAPGQKAQGLAGSPFYMAPELVRREYYGPEVDVWSMGVVLYTSLSGFLPFWGKDHEQTFAAVLKGEPDYLKKPWPSVSREARKLVKRMLHVDSRRRATIDDILSNPWLLQHCGPARGGAQLFFSARGGGGGAAAAAVAAAAAAGPGAGSGGRAGERGGGGGEALGCASTQQQQQLPTPPSSPNPLKSGLQGFPAFKPTPPHRTPTPPRTGCQAAGAGYVVSAHAHAHAAAELSPPPTVSQLLYPIANSFAQNLPTGAAHQYAQAGPRTPPASPRSPNTPVFAPGKKNTYPLFKSQPQEAPNRHELVMQRPFEKFARAAPAEELSPPSAPSSCSSPCTPCAHSAAPGKLLYHLEVPR